MLSGLPENIMELLHGLGVLAIVAMTYGFLLRNTSAGVLRSVVVGLVFGLGGILSMLEPVQTTLGVFVDARGVMLVLAGPFGGVAAAIVSAAVCMVFRLWMGGMGATAGVFSIAVASLVGVAFAALVSKHRGGYRPGQLALLAGFCCSMWLPWLILPSEFVWPIVDRMFGPLVLVNLFGVVLLGSFLTAETMRYEAEKRLEREALTDCLTSLPNRRQFDRASASMLRQARASRSPVALLMVDIDRFKAVNDRWGHDVGDGILQQVAETVRASIRKEDVVARYGGEEIIIMMPGVTAAEALAAAERIRTAIDADVFYLNRNFGSVTASVGVASAPGGEADFDRLLKAADRALYRAKHLGRNRVEMADLLQAQAQAA